MSYIVTCSSLFSSSNFEFRLFLARENTIPTNIPKPKMDPLSARIHEEFSGLNTIDDGAKRQGHQVKDLSVIIYFKPATYKIRPVSRIITSFLLLPCSQMKETLHTMAKN